MISSEEHKSKPHPQLKISAIGAMAIFTIAGTLTIMTANDCHSKLAISHLSDSFMPSLLFGVVTWFWWAGIALTMWIIGQRHPVVLKFSAAAVFLHLAVACVIAISHLLLLQATIHMAGKYWHAWGYLYAPLDLITMVRFGGELAVYGITYGFAGLIRAQSQNQEAAVQKLALERQLSQAQLHALQMQMEPHFLFNTLNAITSLVSQHKDEAAMETLAHLNMILRTTLQRRSPEKVPFTEELQLVESYLAIQKVRFADRIAIEIQTTPEARRGLVPCFLLQPLVENAVRHGIERKKNGGLIQTKAVRLGDRLWMQVRDNGNGVTAPSTEGHGIGLSNIRERLAFFYPGEHQFEIETPPEGGYQVTIQIPFEEAPVCN